MMALLGSPLMAADHADADMTKTTPMGDLADLYAWNASDGTNVNLALTVSPFDDGTREFGPSVQYVFHLTRYTIDNPSDDFPITAEEVAVGEESKVICTFTSSTAGECWVVDPNGKTLDYVKGDFSATAGKASASGKLRAFAGRRSDPFFFNLAGFATAKSQLVTLCGGSCPGNLTALSNEAGCPDMATAATTGPIAMQLGAQQNGTAPSVLPPGCSATERDCFNDKNVMALVVQVDKSLIVTDEKKVVSVWASTHAGQ